MAEKFDHVIRVGQRGLLRPRYVREFLLAAELMDLHYRVSVRRRRYPSHWMPLPAPPSSGREEQA